jgi:nucleoside-diphosphate-sugar epimerase
MARVLVTGASGFIGSKLTQRLVERGDDVTCLVRASSKRERLEALGVRFAVGDMRDGDAVRAAVRDAEVVYHLAGLTSAFRAAELMQVNSEAFRNLAVACSKSLTPPTLISVSSLAAAGPSPPDRPRRESDPAAPVSHYGRAKRGAELIAEQFAAQMPITVIRPPIVFGEGDLLMRNLFRSIFRFGFHLALSISGTRYSFVHVDDLVGAMMLCAERGARLAPAVRAAPGESVDSARGYYFVAVDEQPTFAELGSLIATSLGRQSVRIWRSSGPVAIWSAAATAELFARLRGRPYIFNFDKAREAMAGHWICSTETIRRELGFAPRAAFADRLQQTAQWYQLHGWL